jgi:SAM-dependent methyltransferase
VFGRELAYSRSNPISRIAYRLLGDLNMGGRTRAWYVLDELKRLKLDGMKILDAGSGYGPYTFHIARRYPTAEVTGIEIDPLKVSLCRDISGKLKLGNVRFIEGDLTEMKFKDEFDLILCSDVLEHIPDDRKAVERIYAALKPGGVFLLHAPGLHRKPPLWERGVIGRIHARWLSGHLKGKPAYYLDARAGYSAEEILTLLSSVGFRIERIRPTYGRVGMFSFTLFKLGRIFPLLYPLLLPLIMILGYAEVIRPPRVGISRVITAVKPKPH